MVCSRHAAVWSTEGRDPNAGSPAGRRLVKKINKLLFNATERASNVGNSEDIIQMTLKAQLGRTCPNLFWGVGSKTQTKKKIFGAKQRYLFSF